DHSHFHDQPIGWLTALLEAMNVPLPQTEPELQLPVRTLAAIDDRYEHRPRPWIVLGIGASHPDKDWPDDYWAELLAGLRQRSGGTIFLIGGAANSARAQALIARADGEGAAAVNACELELTDAGALLHLADLFVGTDSGPMNLLRR